MRCLIRKHILFALPLMGIHDLTTSVRLCGHRPLHHLAVILSRLDSSSSLPQDPDASLPVPLSAHTVSVASRLPESGTRVLARGKKTPRCRPSVLPQSSQFTHLMLSHFPSHTLFLSCSGLLAFPQTCCCLRAFALLGCRCCRAFIHPPEPSAGMSSDQRGFPTPS